MGGCKEQITHFLCVENNNEYKHCSEKSQTSQERPLNSRSSISVPRDVSCPRVILDWIIGKNLLDKALGIQGKIYLTYFSVQRWEMRTRFKIKK